MSALPPKADMCSAAVHLRYGPKADMVRLFETKTLFARPLLQQSGRRSLRWAKYFSYSAREITPPSCLTRARSLAGNEA
jgi:hypothetical protein